MVAAMTSRPVMKTAILAILAGTFVFVAPAMRLERVAEHSNSAAMVVHGARSPEVALGLSPLSASASRRSVPLPTPATSGVVLLASVWVVSSARPVVTTARLSFTDRRRRAPPLSFA
jgi:hypothetical protein